MDESLITELAVACQRGDQRSFRVLVEALSRPLIAMAYRDSGDWEWSRDLTQDTWVKVWERIDTFDAERPFSHWLHPVHRNACLDHVRRQWVRRESPTEARVLDRLAGSGTDHPLAELERLEFQERLRVAAQQRTSSQRAVFLRVDVDGGDQTSVAEEMGMRPRNLGTTLHFARRRIARVLRSVDSMWRDVEVRIRRPDHPRLPWITPALAAASVALLATSLWSFEALRDARQRETALTDALRAQEARIAALVKAPGPSPLGRTRDAAVRAGWVRSLEGRRSVPVDEFVEILESLPSGMVLLDERRLRKVVEARLVPATWRRALADLDTDRPLRVGDLLEALREMDLPRGATVAAGRLLDLLA